MISCSRGDIRPDEQTASARMCSIEAKLRYNGSMHVNDLLKIAVERGASDLHLKVGSVPMLRVRGGLMPATADKRLDHEDMMAFAGAVIPTATREKFTDNHEIDLA